MKPNKLNKEEVTDQAWKIAKDLEKWTKKLNMMALISNEGKAPTILKAILMKRFTDYWCEGTKEKNKKRYEEAEKIVDSFLKEFGSFKITNDIKMVERVVYGK